MACNHVGVCAFWYSQTKVALRMGQLELRKSSAIRCGNPEGRLVVVSNRVALPSSARTPAAAGGLAVAMEAVLKARG
ncbi:MAG: hypothetical protein ACREDV_06865, partial [Methylocella sp.]